MSSLCNGGAPDAYALVAYLPDPLASFVDRVRREISPGCRLRAHITILPPRQLNGDVLSAERELHAAVSQIRPVRIEVQEVKLFPISNVIYLSLGEALGAGFQELQDLHARLDQGVSKAEELWCYHPHVTLAQDLTHDQLSRAREVAEQRWMAYAGPRECMLDKLSFVQGNPEHGWIDLAAFEFAAPVLA